MGSCFRVVLECVQGPSYSVANYSHLDEVPAVRLDTNNLGQDVVIVKNGHRICGTGGALGNAPLVQDKSYFEVKIQQTGVWGLGVACRGVDLNNLPLGEDAQSWVLRQDSQFYHSGEVVGCLSSTEPVDEGDVIGFTFDHVDLKLYRNGDATPCAVSGVKGTVYPVVYVGDGAILDVQFSGFWYSPPSGFGEIMVEQTIL